MECMKKPVLSVIVAIYNVDKYLAKCLDALINQTLSDIEIICVNDGATDGSANILKKYAEQDYRIKIINQKNKGLAGARNTGLRHARTSLVMFCDGDDYYDLTMCEEMYQAISENDVDMAICGIKNIYQTKYNTRLEDEEYFRIKFTGKQDISENVVLKTDVSACNKIFKKEIIDNNKLQFPEGLRHEDNYFFLTYTSVSNTIFFLNKCLYNYVRRDDSIMSNTFKGAGYPTEHLLIAEKYFDFLVEHNIFSKYQKLFWKTFILFYDFAYRYAPNGACRKQIRNQADNFIRKNASALSGTPPSLVRQVRKLTSSTHFIAKGTKNLVRKTILKISPSLLSRIKSLLRRNKT